MHVSSSTHQSMHSSVYKQIKYKKQFYSYVHQRSTFI